MTYIIMEPVGHTDKALESLLYGREQGAYKYEIYQIFNQSM